MGKYRFPIGRTIAIEMPGHSVPSRTIYATLEYPDNIIAGGGVSNTFRLYADEAGYKASVFYAVPNGIGDYYSIFSNVDVPTTPLTKNIVIEEAQWQNTPGSSLEITIGVVPHSLGNITASFTVYASPPQSMAPNFDIVVSPTSNIIQGKTSVTASISNAAGKIGASIASQSISILGQTDSNSLTITPKTSGVVLVSATVTDSRGLSTTKTSTFNVVAYSPPLAPSIEAVRVDGQGNLDVEGTSARVKVAWSPGGSVGGATTCTLKYRALGDAAYTGCAELESDSDESDGLFHAELILDGPFDTELDYEFVATAADSLSSVPGYGYLDKAYFTLDFRKGGHGIAIGQACTEDGLTINMPTQFNKPISELSFDDTGANGGWINGKTLFDKVPIHFNVPHVVDGSRFDPLIAGKDVNGNYWAFGQGAGQEICFVGFKANRTENGVDWKVSINTLTGALSSSNIAPNVPLMAYPVGAVYISNNSTSPASLFGGSWTPVDNVFPRFSAFSEGIRNGGSNTHTLTANEMPSHTHGLSTSVYLNDNSVTKSGAHSTWWNTKRNDTRVTASASGGGGAHNNVPYYRTFYAWIRTA